MKVIIKTFNIRAHNTIFNHKLFNFIYLLLKSMAFLFFFKITVLLIIIIIIFQMKKKKIKRKHTTQGAKAQAK